MGQLMEFTGLDAKRLRARWVSSAEAPEFRAEIQDFVQALKNLGPSPLGQAMPGREAA